jgi:hypothetical protein
MYSCQSHCDPPPKVRETVHVARHPIHCAAMSGPHSDTPCRRLIFLSPVPAMVLMCISCECPGESFAYTTNDVSDAALVSNAPSPQDVSLHSHLHSCRVRNWIDSRRGTSPQSSSIAQDRLVYHHGLWRESRLGIRYDAGSKDAEGWCRLEAIEIARKEVLCTRRLLKRSEDTIEMGLGNSAN